MHHERSSSLHDANQDALDEVEGADGLIEVAVDRKWFAVPIPTILPLYYSECTEVRGKAIRFTEGTPWTKKP